MWIRFALVSVTLAAALIGCARAGAYKDGAYEGMSKASYTNEPFMGEAKVVIKNGRIAAVDFKIVDVSKNEVFDQNYEKHYAGNDVYVAQCRADWKGVQSYPARLLEAQDLMKVDAIASATWSYNIFMSSVDLALKKAK